jgi:hypothetical protein
MNLKRRGHWMAAALGTAGALAACFALTAAAKTTAEQAARLGADLTPMGAEAAANSDGSIPLWNGGQTAAPERFAGPGTRYLDPYPDDKPLFIISAANLGSYRAHLSAGQIALFEKFPDSYKMKVYPSRRSFANPAYVYEAARRNALSAELSSGGDTLNHAVTAIPFPIPATGQEAIWNHRLRYRDVSTRRWSNQFAVSATGEYNWVKLREDWFFAYGQPGITPQNLDGILFYFVQALTEPARLAGAITLVHEALDGAKEPRKAWTFTPDQVQTRMRRSSNIAYDNFAAASDGLATNDQTDLFNGALDRYDWKLEDKRELYLPVNSYVLHGGEVKYTDIVKKGHVNQELPRYELRRVWVVDARVKKGGIGHLYPRRSFYLDEDSWQVALVDVYDADGELARVQEGHSLIAYDKPYQMPVMETIYDLPSGRYLVRGLNNEDAETASHSFEPRDFEPSRAARLSRK